jgi:hypothetical protein
MDNSTSTSPAVIKNSHKVTGCCMSGEILQSCENCVTTFLQRAFILQFGLLRVQYRLKITIKKFHRMQVTIEDDFDSSSNALRIKTLVALKSNIL